MKSEGFRHRHSLCLVAAMTSALLSFATATSAQETKIVKTDMQIDGLDPGIKLFLRGKMTEGNNAFTDDNVVLFLHGATSPSTCDFDLAYKDYSGPIGS